MKPFFTFIINTLYVLVILFVVVSLSFVAFSKKVQIAEQNSEEHISGTVVKQEVPLLSTINGSVHTVNIKVGQRVHQGDILLQLTASQSATPKSKSTKESVQDTDEKITAPIDGIVEKVFVQEGFAVSPDSSLVTLLSDDNISVSVSVSDEQYHRLVAMKQVYFYSQRLDQSFGAIPGLIDPSVDVGDNALINGTNTISYTFTNPRDAISLLQGEKLQIVMPSPSSGLSFSLSQLRSLLHL